MLKNIATLIIMALIFNLSMSGFVFAQDKETIATEKIKKKVAGFGTKDQRRTVKLKDKTVIKGYINEIKDDHFVFLNDKTGVSTNISYDQVKVIRRTYSNSVEKLLIVTGITIVALLVIVGICVAKGPCDE